MPSPKPFRFGIQHYPAASRHEWEENASRAEELGYDIFLMPDHIGQGGLAWAPALMSVASVTTRIRLGTLVLCNDFRHPALVASETATLDLLSDGRFELGIGAGWDRSDYTAAGLPFDEARVRVDRFEEGVQIIKDLMAGDPVTFQGDHYTIQDLTNAPQPVQGPHPPLLIGASGPRMLSISAREADSISIMPPGIGSENGPDLTEAAMIRAIERLCASAADRFDHLELGTLLQRLIVTDEPRSAARELAQQWRMSVEDTLASPWVLIGTRDEIIDELRRRRDRFRLTYWAVPAWYMNDFAPVVVELAGQ